MKRFYSARSTMFATLLACGLSANAAQVEVIAQATISYLDDQQNGLSHLEMGSQVTIKYVYDTSAEDISMTPERASYSQTHDLASLTVTLGNTTFNPALYGGGMYAGGQPIYSIDIDADESLYGEHYSLGVSQMEFNNNVQIDAVAMDLAAPIGTNVLDAPQLTTTAPDLASYSDFHELTVQGLSNGNVFHLMATVHTLTSQVIMPAPGTSVSFFGTAQVVEIMDGPLVLDGRVAMDDVVDFEFTVNRSLPDLDSQDGFGVYVHSSTFGTMKFTLPDGTVIESQKKLEAHVIRDPYFHSFSLFSLEPAVTGNAFSPEAFDILFERDLQMNAPLLTDDTIPLDKLSRDLWTKAELYFGRWMDGWHLRADILTIESVIPTDVNIAPSDDTWHPSQRFDAAIRHSMSGEFSALTGTLNGQTIDTYLQSCVAHGPVDNLETLVCPDTHQLLIPGTNTFTVDFLLHDQRTVSKTVNWVVQP